MKIYTFDGGEIGFYSAVFSAYREKNCFVTSGEFQRAFGDEIIPVESDGEKARRVKNAFFGIAGATGIQDVKTALRSCLPDKENIAFNYVRLAFEEKKDVRRYFSHPDVVKFNDIVSKVWHERHRFTGFLRFHETESGVMYAHYEPDNDITDLLAPFFKARMGKLPFIIHDVKRSKFALWSGSEMRYITTEEPVNIALSDKENQMQALWHKYIDSVNIPERPHKKLQDGFLPRRYRKHMSEFY